MASNEPEPTTHRREVIRIIDLIDRSTGNVHDRRFDDCDVYGPAVLGAVGPVVVEGCEFDAPMEEVSWHIPSGSAVRGAISLSDVEFVGCRFHDIGLIVVTDAEDADESAPVAS